MTTTFTVNSPRCDHKAKIVTEMKSGGRISIAITSSCKNIQEYAKVMTEIQTRDIYKKILENPVYITASSVVGPECMVPCTVISAVWTEAGLVAKSLLRMCDTITIKYEDETPCDQP
jgi:hypothetical protein